MILLTDADIDLVLEIKSKKRKAPKKPVLVLVKNST